MAYKLLGVLFLSPSPMVQEADNRPCDKGQREPAGGIGGLVMGSAKVDAPILIWRGLENPEVNFAFRVAALDGG